MLRNAFSPHQAFQGRALRLRVLRPRGLRTRLRLTLRLGAVLSPQSHRRLTTESGVRARDLSDSPQLQALSSLTPQLPPPHTHNEGLDSDPCLRPLVFAHTSPHDVPSLSPSPPHLTFSPHLLFPSIARCHLLLLQEAVQGANPLCRLLSPSALGGLRGSLAVCLAHLSVSASPNFRSRTSSSRLRVPHAQIVSNPSQVLSR